MDIIEPADILWVHDYHLMLLPLWLKRRFPQNPLGFFLHTPFPSPDIFTILPWKEQVLFGLSGADLTGFHTQSYARNFLNCVKQFLGFPSNSPDVYFGKHKMSAREFPLGVNCDMIEENLSSEKMEKSVSKLKKKFKGRKIILSIDRMDYSKGIPQRLKGIELFLEKNPSWQEKCQFIMLCQPSRMKIVHYTRLKETVEKMVGRINGRFGRPGWLPIRYMFRSLPFHRLLPLYSAADIALVTPWYDGMNLVSKEFVSSKLDTSGVLILSETAGAAQELREALLINIHDENAVAAALNEALQMGDDEIHERMAAMRQRVSQNTSQIWMKSFLECLTHSVSPPVRETAVKTFSCGAIGVRS